MPRPISVCLDQHALAYNLALSRQLAPNTKVWAVVKANAYGHRLSLIWQGLAAADGFALLDLDEAILLREAGWQGPILLLEGFFTVNDLELVDKYRLTACIHHSEQLSLLAATKLTQPIDIYLKLNSGMNRLGFPHQQFSAAWQRARSLSQVKQIVIMSHFARADTKEGINKPLAIISRTTKNLIGERSFANSATILWHPEACIDWIRPGVILYGASPTGKWQDIANTGLRPAMSLKSQLIGIQSLKIGDQVGYGGSYTAKQAHRIGIVACGYADGYPRHAPTGTPIIVEGIKTQLLGTVSMDMLAVDLTHCPQAKLGSSVELWGANLPVDEVACAAGTVGYELLTAITPRVPATMI